MTFLIGAANSATGGYEIDNSLRFNDGDNPFLARTPSSSGSRTIATVSFWTKRSELGDEGYMLEASSSTSPFNMTRVRFSDNDELIVDNTLNGGASNGFMFQSTRRFRDPSAWYHIFFSIDVTQANATDGWLLYVNGVQQTKALTNWTQNANLEISQDNVQMNVGRRHDNSSDNFDGYLAEYHYIDGTRKLYTDFGEFNDNGVWIPKEYDGGSYGTNGFYLQFKQTGTSANASGIGADTSGNDNHFAVTNLAATDVTVDTPTNNFATMNPVHKSSHGSAALPTFSEGNTKIAMISDSSTSSTIAPSKGKWYVEYKQGENTADNGGYPIVGLSATLGGTAGDVIGFRTPSGTDYRGQLGTTSVSNAFGSVREADDIFGFYINLDDDILIVHKDGSNYMGSGASSGLNWSGGLTTTNTQTGFYHFYVQNNFDGSPAYTDEVNFGNAPFAISSGNADANGFGNFEFSPTLGGVDYFAMCTKNLARYG